MALDGVAQVGLEPQQIDGGVVHRGVEHRVGAAAAALGAIHRRVGVAHDVLTGAVVVGADGDADARAWRRPRARRRGTAPSTDSGCARPRAPRRPAGGCRRAARRTRRRRSAPASGRPARSSSGRGSRITTSSRRTALASRSANGTQQLVAGPVAQAVVDALEPIEVDEEHGELVVAVADAPGHRPLEPLAEQHAVGQVRQRVVDGVVDEPVVGLAQARAHVVERRGHGDRLGAALHRQAKRQIAGRQRRGRRGDVAQRPAEPPAEHQAERQADDEHADAAGQEPGAQPVDELLASAASRPAAGAGPGWRH